MARNIQNDSFPIKGWQWIFYIFGLVTGILSILFWLLMVILYFSIDKSGPFFNAKFHKRVFWWGVVMSVFVFIILLLIGFFLILL